MTIQSGGTAGIAYRQKPGAPHIVQQQNRPGAKWKKVTECRTAWAAQQWILHQAKRVLQERNQSE